jgi:hypothetical protein
MEEELERMRNQMAAMQQRLDDQARHIQQAMPTPVEPGSHLCAGRYVVTEVIRDGSMGKVVRADEVASGRVVAIKVCYPREGGELRLMCDQAESTLTSTCVFR